jgi:hypothetical protein
MQGTTEPFIPTYYVINGRAMGGTMRRKNGIRTLPQPTAAVEIPAMPPPPTEDEDLPAAKRPRLQAPTSISTAADGVTTDSPDDTPTDPVTPAASVPSAATSSAPRRSWTPAEDLKLKEAVQKHGRKWVAVATLVPGRTNLQCRDRWVNTVDHAFGKKGKWTPEEDATLTEAVYKHGKDCWAVVAKLVIGRTDKQCRRRWVDTLDPAPKKGRWTREEDGKLTEAINKHGKEWVAVAALVMGRTDKQCRERWTHTLGPANGNTGEPRRIWKPQEDAKLTEAIQKHGNAWVAVAALVTGRTDKQCRERWTHTLGPANGNTGRPRRSWTPQEDAKLTEAVINKHGKELGWVAVAALVTGRTAKQCHQRWTQNLGPAAGNKGEWTFEEDTKLAEAVKKHGKNWVAVAAMVPGRTNKRCRKRWFKILDPDRASKTAVEEKHTAGNDEAFDSVAV